MAGGLLANLICSSSLRSSRIFSRFYFSCSCVALTCPVLTADPQQKSHLHPETKVLLIIITLKLLCSGLTRFTCRFLFIGRKPPNCGGGKLADVDWRWFVLKADCGLCAGPLEVEGLGRLSNLASRLKKVLGGREGARELPKTDWRVLGCSDRKLSKLTNCWFVGGGREGGRGLPPKDCWPGKLTGPPVGRAWPDWN